MAVRPSLQFLIKNRKADGSFGDQAATAWTIDALTGFDADGYRDEVAQARKWLAANGGGAEPGLQAAVAAVIEQVRADVFPEHLAAGAKKQVWAGMTRRRRSTGSPPTPSWRSSPARSPTGNSTSRGRRSPKPACSRPRSRRRLT